MKERFKKYTDIDTYSRIVDYSSVSEMWESVKANFGDYEALKTFESALTYNELDKIISHLRAYIKESGINPGDRVGLYLPNSISFVSWYLALTTYGCCAVLLPPHLDDKALYGCSLKFSLKALVYFDTFKEKLALLSSMNKTIKLISSSSTSLNGLESNKVGEDFPCTIIFTGGTTGKSKGSLLSNKAIMRGTKNGCYGIKEIFNQRYLLVLPLTHVFGLIRNLLTSLYTGSSLYICQNNADMFRDISIFKPTIFVLVPALAEMCLKLSKKFKRNMLGEDMKTIICGAAFVPPYLIKEYHDLGITLLPGYGLTESANLVSGNPEALLKPDSVGLVYEGIETKVIDGELWLKGINMQDSYFGEEEENSIAYEDGWFKTGDLVRFDEDGYLYITGRKKEIIVLPNGENVSPAELEAKFVTIDLIQDCLVYENDFGTLELEVFIRDTVVAIKGIEDPKSVIQDEVNKINDTLLPHEKITKVVFRQEDFVRSPALKIVRSKNGNIKK